MAMVLRCEDFLPKCPYAEHGATEEDVLRAATTHLAEVHQITALTPGIAAPVKRNIRTA
jgi:predicted small metal-binding protein